MMLLHRVVMVMAIIGLLIIVDHDHPILIYKVKAYHHFSPFISSNNINPSNSFFSPPFYGFKFIEITRKSLRNRKFYLCIAGCKLVYILRRSQKKNKKIL